MKHNMMRRFRPNRFQLLIHKLYEFMLIMFFTVNSCVIVAIFVEPSIRRKFDGMIDQVITITFLFFMVLLSGILSNQQYSKLYYYIQEKRKRDYHEYF